MQRPPVTQSSHGRGRSCSRAAALLAAVATVAVVPAASRASDTSVTIDFSIAGGAPSYHASGTLYGMTPDGSAPQDHFYTDLKWHFERAGGAQLDSGGYATSLADYQTRWSATLAQYKRTAALGGTFILLPHDLWGADGTTSQAFPGDNGDWTLFDSFVNQLFSDVKSNNMTVQWDLWNEPDGYGFWPRSQSQYLQLWSRFYAAVRTNFPGQLIVGPSMAGQPVSSDSWWTTYLSYIKTNNVAPDIYSWHDEPADPVPGASSANSTLASYGLTNTRPYQINEYGALSQQNPGGGAWFIGRLERA